MALLETVQDNFDSNSLNTSVWTAVTGSGATIANQNQRIEVQMPASSTSSTFARLVTATTYDLTGSYAYVQVIQVPAAASSATDADFVVAQDATLDNAGRPTNGFRFVKEGATLFAQKTIAGTTTTVSSQSYSSANHAWWRIREQSGVIFWEVSPDGGSWHVFATFSHSMTITAMYLHIGEDSWAVQTSPLGMFFDNVSINGVNKGAAFLGIL